LLVDGRLDLNDEELLANVPMAVNVHVVAVEALADFAPFCNCRGVSLRVVASLLTDPIDEPAPLVDGARDDDTLEKSLREERPEDGAAAGRVTSVWSGLPRPDVNSWIWCSSEMLGSSQEWAMNCLQ
jgi:hypothetical protein